MGTLLIRLPILNSGSFMFACLVGSKVFENRAVVYQTICKSVSRHYTSSARLDTARRRCFTKVLQSPVTLIVDVTNAGRHRRLAQWTGYQKGVNQMNVG
jgi:hypothetical protein